MMRKSVKYINPFISAPMSATIGRNVKGKTIGGCLRDWLIPRIGYFDLFVELLGCVVQSFQAGRTANGGLRLDVPQVIAAADAGGQKTIACIARMVELCAAMFATNFVSCSHSCTF